MFPGKMLLMGVVVAVVEISVRSCAGYGCRAVRVRGNVGTSNEERSRRTSMGDPDGWVYRKLSRVNEGRIYTGSLLAIKNDGRVP